MKFRLFFIDDRLDRGEQRGDLTSGSGVPGHAAPEGATSTRAAHGGTGRR